MGTNALMSNTIGNYNIGLGAEAGMNALGDSNTFIGATADVQGGLPLQYATAIGAGAKVATSNAIVLGRSNDRVGIATATPSYTLDVAGTARATSFIGDGSQLTGISSYTLPANVVTNNYAGGVSINGNISANSVTLGGARILAYSSDFLLASNFFAGPMAGNTTMSGQGNNALGYQALSSNTSGEQNNAFGTDALIRNTGGAYNNALGYRTLWKNTIGWANNAIGSNTLRYNTEGNYNNAIGDSALFTNVTGHDNNALGTSALWANLAYYNNAIGNGALGINESGHDNNALGYLAGNLNWQGNYNTFLGSQTNVQSVAALSYATAVGAGVKVATSNAIVLGRNNDRVGIATSTPSYTLDVAGTVNATAFIGDGSLLTGIGSYTLPANVVTNNYTGGVSVNGTVSANSLALNGMQVLVSGNNFGIGVSALISNTTGYYNNALGYWALYSNTTGYKNNALGEVALAGNTTGYINNALGASALDSNTSGWGNNALGYLTLKRTTSGFCNTALGTSAGYEAIGNYNTFIGTSADQPAGVSLSYATAIGAGATVATSNAIVLGRSNDRVGIATATPSYTLDVAGTVNATAISANRIMVGALPIHAYGNNNFGAGIDTLINNTTGAGNNALGSTALRSNTSGGYNNALGEAALQSNTSGFGNNALGTMALVLNTTGHDNNALGDSALYSNLGGGNNNAIGLGALQFNTEGSNNNALGTQALYLNTTGFNNAAMGYQALYSNTTGINNTALGAYTLFSNTSGEHNNAIGNGALYYNTTGYYNAALGYRAGMSVSGDYNAFIGFQADIVGGLSLQNATAIGKNAKVATSNAIVLGGTGANAVRVGIGTPTPNGVLDIVSVTQGVVIPRMTQAQRNAIVGAVAGMMIFQTDATPGLRVYNGTNWMRFTETID